MNVNEWSDGKNFSMNMTGDPSEFYADGRPVALVLLIIAVLAAFLNSILLAAYVKFKDLKTTFHIYLLGLAITDLMQALIVIPGQVIMYWTKGWPFGYLFCTLYEYCSWTLAGAVTNLHCVVSLNRLFAVTFPVHYRNFHSKRVAFGVCVGLWIYVNAWMLPQTIMDHLFYRTDTIYDCYVNFDAVPKWTTAFNVVVFDIPACLTITVYPIILYKVCKLRRKQQADNFVSRDNPTFETGGFVAMKTTSDNSTKPVSISFTSERKLSQIQPSTEHTTRPKPSTSETSIIEPKPNHNHSHGRNNRGLHSGSHLKILTLLVAGLLIFWLPNTLYNHLVAATDYSFSSFSSITLVLFYMNSVLNPIFYALASEKWRKAFKRIACFT